MSTSECNRSVLVVEDEPLTQWMLRLFLTKRNYECVLATRGDEALDIVQNRKFDVIIMDLLIPTIDGIEVTRHIRELEMHSGDKTPIIAITASYNLVYEGHFRSAGFTHALRKPFTAQALYGALDKVLAAAPVEVPAAV